MAAPKFVVDATWSTYASSVGANVNVAPPPDGVVTVAEFDSADRLPAASVACTEYVYVVFGLTVVSLNVVVVPPPS